MDVSEWQLPWCITLYVGSVIVLHPQHSHQLLQEHGVLVFGCPWLHLQNFMSSKPCVNQELQVEQ